MEYNERLGKEQVIKFDMRRKDNYLPRTEQWIVDTMALYGMGLVEAIFYQMVVNQGYVIWTVDWIADLLKVSPRTLHRMLEKLEFWEFIVRRSIPTGIGNRERVVTVARFLKDKTRSDEEIESLIKEGIRDIKTNESERQRYK